MAVRVRIKFCGMRLREDIAFAASLGVDAIGLIFYPKSPRFISLTEAEKLTQKLPAFMNTVAVFANATTEEVLKVIQEIPVQLLQFHGQESPEFCNQFAKPYIKAIPATSEAAVMALSQDYEQAAAILLDTPSQNLGGTGQQFDWKRVPREMAKPLILAGGLNADNVNEAIKQCSPYAVDVCSGVESSPGIKDHNKMKQFVNAVWG